MITHRFQPNNCCTTHTASHARQQKLCHRRDEVVCKNYLKNKRERERERERESEQRKKRLCAAVVAREKQSKVTALTATRQCPLVRVVKVGYKQVNKD